jgi:hypothetical protein
VFGTKDLQRLYASLVEHCTLFNSRTLFILLIVTAEIANVCCTVQSFRLVTPHTHGGGSKLIAVPAFTVHLLPAVVRPLHGWGFIN